VSPIYLLAAALAGALVAGLFLILRRDAHDLTWHEGHERLAREREARAIERHEKEMRELQDARRLTLAAINQRIDLERAVGWLLAAAMNHAGHLEELGRTDVQKYPPPKQ
jgi:hypothetical protein